MKITIEDNSSTEIANVRNELIEFENYKIVPITDRKTAESAGNLLKGAKKFRTEIEDTRKRLVEPYKSKASEIDKTVKPYRDKLDKFISDLSDTIYRYQKEQERLQIEAENKRRAEEADKLRLEQEKLEKEMAEKGSETVLEEAIRIEEKIEKIEEQPIETITGIRSGYSLTTSKEHWVHTVIAPDLVPREYCEPSDRLIKQALKNGVREIPGLKIEDKGIVRSN